ncbi:SGT1-domain-containing protein [Paxillus ammoniavirescens]|nr:SGT1-domain-containing protein [Paxillus ammoniavirescens]
MDIFNRPPSISEDMLRYTLYPPLPLADKPSCASLAACIHDLVPKLLPDFLWHRDPFQLKIAPDPDARLGEDKNVLEGCMRVGDCVDDEWCVVWLLREISKQWDLVLSVSDSDGEFLLIEAAEFLPGWLNPSNATNRVWIHRGRLHLIPLSHVSAPNKPRRRRNTPGAKESDNEDHIADENDDGYLAVEDALPLVRDVSLDILAPKAVEDAVWQRISGYPGAARKHVHTSKAYLPVDIARALTVDPSLIQKPIETFYTRDAIQLRAAHKMARFSPHPNVLCNVKMTRTAYAQLLGQKFFPPKIFGHFEEREGTDTWRWRDVGMKLACGFEMLFQESKNRADAARSTVEALNSSAEALKDALRCSPDYKAYLTRLVTVGYFRNEVEGSQLWNELENKAAHVYVEVRREDDASRPSFAALFNTALSRAPEVLPDSGATQAEDSDEWMNIDAADFENVLKSTMHGPGSNMEAQAMDVDPAGGGEEDRLAQEQTEKLRGLAAKVERFVEGEGDVEGARFEDEAFSDDDVTDGDDEADQFRDESFSDSGDEDSDDENSKTNEAARQQLMANLVPALPASEYGQMPASFNTQRVSKTIVLTETVAAASLEDTDTVDTASDKFTSPPRTRPIRAPLLPRDRYEGVDSDDESSSSDPLAGGDDEDGESEEDRPQVVGEIEVDMNEEEAEFLEFSRQALGISDEMWSDIVKERQGRGAFVPTSVTIEKKPFSAAPVPAKEAAKQSNIQAAAPETFRTPAPGPRPNANPNLDSFEAVMQAMDAELSRLRQPTAELKPKQPSPQPLPSMGRDKGKAVAPPRSADIETDIEGSMDAEFKALLEQGDMGDSDEEDGEPSMDYNLIKNFLESFKSQAGLSGPVGNLAGRLEPGWALPRDDS